MPKSSIDTIESTVIAGGYCIGCGLCAIQPNDNYAMRWSPDGTWQAERIGEQQPEPRYLQLCPFSGTAPNEDAIARELFAECCSYDNKVGHYQGLYAGYVKNENYRRDGSSGGLTSWLLEKLLDNNVVDGIIHVQPGTTKGLLFEYSLAYDVCDLRRGRKSQYYPVELSQVLRRALTDNRRYALVGVPCFIKAMRLRQRLNPDWQEKFGVLVGLVCGHLKSAFYAQMLGWQLGIAPTELKAVDFRVKLTGHSANSYGFGAEDQQGVMKVLPTAKLFGANWGYGLFKYQACDYCDDIMGETADISFGDAWLPECVSDEHGTNIVVARNPRLHQMLLDSSTNGAIHLENVSPEKVVESQAASYRHRRDGLAYRLYLASKKEKWVPQKRVSPSAKINTARFRRIIETRLALRELSFVQFHKALQAGHWQDFPDGLKVVLRRYQLLYRPSLFLMRQRVVWLIRLLEHKLTRMVFPK